MGHVVYKGALVTTHKLSFRMAPKLYFIGNIFNQDDEVAKYDDRGFAFSDGEKRELELVGLPIQLEHNDKLSVGHVRQSWYEDGQRWVLGDVDREGLDGYFAANAVKSKLYTGLSLQHISYQLEDGTQMKVPVEVSLCEDPRRPDCRVHHHTASARDPYFRLSKRLKQMADATPTPTLEVPVETPVAPAAPAETPEETTHVAAAETKERTQDELYQLLVDQQKEIDAMRGNLTSAQDKVQAFEAEKAAVHKAQAEKAQEKLQGISKSLLEWCAANNFELTDARVEKLAQLAKDHPATAETLFEIAHCASNKHKETVMQLAAQQKQTATAVLQEKVEGVFEKRQNAAGPVTHTAAAAAPVNRFTQRKRKMSPSEAYGMQPNSDLIEALKKQRNSYSGHGSMVELYRDMQKRI